MSQGYPPYYTLPELKALYNITEKGVPDFEKPATWSLHMRDFTKNCLNLLPEERPTISALLQVFFTIFSYTSIHG